MAESATSLTAQRVLDELKACGVTDLIWLPDSESAGMYQALQAEPSIRAIPVCREGEAIPIALGLQVGGRVPVVLMQSTGFYEQADSLRGLAIDLGMPLLLLIGYRGWQRGQPLTDSAATYLEPNLRAWDLPYDLVESNTEVGKIGAAFRRTQTESRPVAVLIGAEYRAS